MQTNKIYQGDCLKTLKTFPDESINCVMTSPPYWALRNYGTESENIWGGKENCKHEWEEIKKSSRGGEGKNSIVGANRNSEANNRGKPTISNFCKKCNAWRGQLGLEPTYDMYISNLCDIFDQIKRVLRKDGTCFVNIGDTYGGGTGTEKNLCNIPARFSIEMQNRGWILRNVILWRKENAMPVSVKDRFTVDFEYVFFFVKNKNYWFEKQYEPHKLESIKRACRARTSGKLESGQYATSYKQEYLGYDNMMERLKNGEIRGVGAKGRNMRTTWTINTKGFKGAHFAVFPEQLCQTPLKSGCPEFVCNECGKPREKIYGKKEYIGEEKSASGKFKNSDVNSPGAREHYMSEQRKYPVNQKTFALFIKSKIKGQEQKMDEKFGQTAWKHWIRTDESGACLPSKEQYLQMKSLLKLDDSFDKEMLTMVKVLVDDKGNKEDFMGLSDCGCGKGFSGGIVLDPFSGAGTTSVVALQQNKRFIGLELNPEYVKISEKRLKPFIEQRKLF